MTLFLIRIGLQENDQSINAVYPLSIQETDRVMHYRFQLRPSHLHHFTFILNIQLGAGFWYIGVLRNKKRQPLSYSNSAEPRNQVIGYCFQGLQT
jgi:hypothetical protein